MKMTMKTALILTTVLILGMFTSAAAASAPAAEAAIPGSAISSENIPEEAAESMDAESNVPGLEEGDITAKTIRNDYLKRGGIGVAVVVVLYAVLMVLNRKGGKSRRKRTRK